MQVVCEATQCNDVPVQVAALQNLVKIMSLYYQYMEAYMGPALFAVSGTYRIFTGAYSVASSQCGHVLASPPGQRFLAFQCCALKSGRVCYV